MNAYAKRKEFSDTWGILLAAIIAILMLVF
jgi:uncharacterized integral membrane protein